MNTCLSARDIIAICALIVSVIALFVGYINLRTSVVSMIENQLSNKAKECNKYIEEKTQAIKQETHYISAILTSIIFAATLLDLYYKSYRFILLRIGKKSCLDRFYLELHTSVIEFVKNNLPNNLDPSLINTIKRQHEKCKLILHDSIVKFNDL